MKSRLRVTPYLQKKEKLVSQVNEDISMGVPINPHPPNPIILPPAFVK